MRLHGTETTVDHLPAWLTTVTSRLCVDRLRATAALPVFVDGRPAAAWFDRGAARVLFDFTITDAVVAAITLRADPAVLERVVRRDGPSVRRSRPRSVTSRALQPSNQ